MGVATYKPADEMDSELLKALPPKEELQRVFEESSRKEKDKVPLSERTQTKKNMNRF